MWKRLHEEYALSDMCREEKRESWDSDWRRAGAADLAQMVRLAPWVTSKPREKAEGEVAEGEAEDWRRVPVASPLHTNKFRSESKFTSPIGLYVQQ